MVDSFASAKGGGVRRVVIQDDLREALIRPESGFTTYIELLEADFRELLKTGHMAELTHCPACESTQSRPDFSKMAMNYVECLQCHTSYMTPRPSMEVLDQFYSESKAIQFWNSAVVKTTAEARRQFITAPRASWILETASAYECQAGIYVDFYTKDPAYLKEVARRGAFQRILIRKPMIPLERHLDPEIYNEVEAAALSGISACSAFEVIERLFDPHGFLDHLKHILIPGGLIFLTTLSISGFDLHLLRGRARNLLPPTHLTLLSYQGIQQLMDRSGFQLLELSTPGRLDVALVLDALERDPAIELPPIIHSILVERGESVHQAFQDFLQQANLSSHVWIVAQKRRQ